MAAITPHDYGLPHDDWRRYQRDTAEWCLAQEGFGALEASTGSGKTAAAAAVSSQKSVIALCKTKNLQAENYGGIYGAEVLFGRGSYDCVHPDAEPGAHCDECLFLEEGMHRCPHANQCKYLLAKARAKASSFTSLNYAYFLTAKWPRENPPQVLFLDEAHNLSATVVDWVGCTVNEKQRVEWQLPRFPTLDGSGGNLLLNTPDPTNAAVGWLEAAQAELRTAYLTLKHAEDRKRLVKCERLGYKVSNALDALRSKPSDWFIRAGNQALSFGREKRPGFVCKPLTARHHFPEYFCDGHATVAMSATIGDPKTFARELGIEEYEFRVVPNQWPAESRQVQILDAPSMGRKATAADFEQQAGEIAKAILSCPRTWSGIILVTRKREAKLLADRLARRGLQDRVWVSPGWDGSFTPTDRQAAAWNERRRRVPGSLCVTWAMWEGWDGLEERILVVAKVAFPYLGSDYERERLRYDGKFFRLRTAWKVEQGLGRTRRGREQDYDLGERRGLVCIADGSWTRVKKYFSQSLREAIEVR